MIFIRRGKNDRDQQGKPGLWPHAAANADPLHPKAAPEQHGEDRVFD